MAIKLLIMVMKVLMMNILIFNENNHKEGVNQPPSRFSVDDHDMITDKINNNDASDDKLLQFWSLMMILSQF